MVPIADRHALSIGVTTIRDQACFGVYADARLLPDADLLAERDRRVGRRAARAQLLTTEVTMTAQYCSPERPGSSGWRSWRGTSSARTPGLRAVRAPRRGRGGRARLRETLECLFGDEDAYADRVFALPRRHRAPGLGLDRARARARSPSRSPTSSTRAASVSFSLPLDAVARDQRRRHAAHARAGRAVPAARRPRALLLHLDGLRGRHARGRVRRGPARRRPAVPQPLRAVEVRGRAARARPRPTAADPDLPARASSSASGPPAGPRPSTCSTRR